MTFSAIPRRLLSACVQALAHLPQLPQNLDEKEGELPEKLS
jgi:hypothetical protein